MADSNEMSLIMRIRTLFDGKGTKEAVDNVAAVGKSAKEMGDNTKAAAGSAEKAFAAINATTQVTEGGVMGVGQAVKNLAGQFPKLSAAVGPVGLLLAAFAAWKKVYDELRERQSAFAKSLRDIASGNADGGVKSTTRYYLELANAITMAEDARKRLSDAEASKDDARLASDLAKLDLAHAEAASKLNPDDTFGRRKLDLETSTKRADLTDAAALRKSDRELADMRGEGAALAKTKRDSTALAQELEGWFKSYSDQYSERYAKAIAEKNAPFNPLEPTKRTTAFARALPDLERLTAKMEEMAKGIQEALAKAVSADQQQFTLGEKAEANRMNRDTQITTSKTGGVTRKNESRQIDFDAAEERERIVRELRDKKDAIRDQEKRQAEMRDKTFKEYGDIRTAREKPLELKGKQTETSYLQAKDAHDKNVEKELQEWKGLATALKENAEKKTKAVGDLRRDIERLNQKLENMPGQSN
jgi:hypothetical protein